MSAIYSVEQSSDSTPPSTSDIRDRVVSELARVLATDAVAIEQDVLESGGDLAIDSPVAEAILAGMEQHFGCTLPGVADLEPDQINSVNALVSLIERGVASLIKS